MAAAGAGPAQPALRAVLPPLLSMLLAVLALCAQVPAPTQAQPPPWPAAWPPKPARIAPPQIELLDPDCEAPPQPVTILHVPKTGGTMLCNLLKRRGQCVVQSANHTNCWVFTDGPEWCCDFVPNVARHGGAREKTCEERRAFPRGFTMIERYLDFDDATNRTLFCDGVTYGVVLRDAVDRATSHAHHFVTAGPLGMVDWRQALFDLLATRPAAEAQLFLDELDALPALSPLSRGLVERTFGAGNWSEMLERQAYKLNAFTSNYLVRMLLGRRLAPVPLLASSRAITPAAMEAARWAMRQFHIVLHTESLMDPESVAPERHVFHGRVEHKERVAPDDALYRRLLGAEFRPWLQRRNRLDAEIVDATANRVPGLPEWWGSTLLGRRQEGHG